RPGAVSRIAGQGGATDRAGRRPQPRGRQPDRAQASRASSRQAARRRGSHTVRDAQLEPIPGRSSPLRTQQRTFDGERVYFRYAPAAEVIYLPKETIT